MRRLHKVGIAVGIVVILIIIAVVVLKIIGYHGSGNVTFGTGVNSDQSDVSGQTSTFSPGQTVYFHADFKETVKQNTVEEQDTQPDGTKLYDQLIQPKDTGDVNNLTGPLATGAAIPSSAQTGKYKVEFLSKGKVESSGTFTVTATRK